MFKDNILEFYFYVRRETNTYAMCDPAVYAYILYFAFHFVNFVPQRVTESEKREVNSR